MYHKRAIQYHSSTNSAMTGVSKRWQYRNRFSDCRNLTITAIVVSECRYISDTTTLLQQYYGSNNSGCTVAEQYTQYQQYSNRNGSAMTVT